MTAVGFRRCGVDRTISLAFGGPAGLDLADAVSETIAKIPPVRHDRGLGYVSGGTTPRFVVAGCITRTTLPGGQGMKTRDELQHLVELIHSDSSPVGMDAVYVHALILDKLQGIERRLEALENRGELSGD